jgi:myo-inositol-1(or 4)-monophosphatase
MQALAGIAQSAGRLALDARKRGLREWTKHGNELVTSAEVLIHEHVTTEIARLCPGVAMVTEESKTHEIPQARFIVVDEIDGTAPFAAGADTWGVMLALVDEAPTCGVIHLPERQVTITAQRGQGCWIDGRRIHLQFDGALRDALAGVDVSTRADDAGWRLIRNVAAGARAIRSFSCAAASLLELLEGVTQVYVNPAGGKIWDFAPLAVAITEAGGIALTADGAPLQWNRVVMGFLAGANAALIEEVLALR